MREVRISNRLVDSAACLVVDEFQMSLHMQKLMKAVGQDVPATAPILEVNPSHALVQRLQGEVDDATVADYAALLFDQAMLAESGSVDDPAAFIARVNRMIAG